MLEQASLIPNGSSPMEPSGFPIRLPSHDLTSGTPISKKMRGLAAQPKPILEGLEAADPL